MENFEPLEETIPSESSRRREIANPYLPYRTALLSTERVRELSVLRPWIPVSHTALSWAIILSAWYLCAVTSSWFVVLLAIPIIGNRYYALFIVGHDAFHRRLFSKTEYNDLFSDLFVHGALGAITRINKQNHLAHHSQLATPEDPDRAKHCCFGKSEFFQLIGYLTGVTTIWRSIVSVYLKPIRGEVGREKQHTRRDLGIIVGWQLMLLFGLSFFIGWWAYPILWLLPVYLFTYLADGLRSFAEHSQPYQDSIADEHRLITYHAPWWERILFSPMNMNYHAIHHLWPSIPYYNLPIADGEVRRNLVGGENLEWRNSYLGYLWRYIRKLPLEECRIQ